MPATRPSPGSTTGLRRGAVAALLALTFLTALGVASASSLGVTSGSRTSSSATSPCPGTAVVQPANPTSSAGTQFSAVRVILPVGCSGARDVQVAFRQSGTNYTGSAQITGSGVVTMSSAYTAAVTATVMATLNGWNLPATWAYLPTTCTIPASPSATCYTDLTVFNGSKPGGGVFTYYDIVIRTTSTTPVVWEATILMAHPSLPGAPTRLGNSTLDAYSDGQTSWSSTGSINDVRRTSSCSASPAILTVQGKTSGPADNTFDAVVAGRDRQFSLVLNYNQVPYYDVYFPGCTTP